MQNAKSFALAMAAGLSFLAVTPDAGAQTTPPAARDVRKLDSVLAEQFGVLSHIRPSREAVMGFGQPTRVTEILVRGGRDVTVGQTILRGDDVEERAMLTIQKKRAESDLPVQSARAEMDLAESEHKRLEELLAKGGSGLQEVERARLSFDVKRFQFLNAQLQQVQEVLQVDRLKARVDRLSIQAPFDGVVDNIQVDVGQSVSENDKIVRVVNVDTLMIDVGAEMGSQLTLDLKVGDPAWVLVDVAGVAKLRHAKVTEVAPTADLGSRTRRVRVEFANPKGADRVIPGGPSWVRFSEPSEELLAKFSIPALHARAQNSPTGN